jgi:aspartate-semialdehyde dehydrogenase
VNVAVVGVTGVVGETILRILDERAVAVDDFAAFASRAREAPLQWRGRDWPIRAATPESLREGAFDAVFFASSEDASGDLAPHALAGGAVVIDNSSAFRMLSGVPLLVPEVNAHHVLAEHRIFPVANCTAIVLCVGIAPIARAAGLASVRVATYQAVSGAGKAGLDALASEEAAEFARAAPDDGARSPFVRQVFRNVVPQIGAFGPDGTSEEERKVADETRKILDLPDLDVAVTAVRVPVRYAHSEAVFFETARDTSVAELGAALAAAPGVAFHASGVVTPLEVEGGDLVHVARLRAEGSSKRRFQAWLVGDQARKGAATNAVQILELLVERGRFARSRVGAP